MNEITNQFVKSAEAIVAPKAYLAHEAVVVGKVSVDQMRILVQDNKRYLANQRRKNRIAQERRAEKEAGALLEESRVIMASELKKNGGPSLKVPMIRGRMVAICEAVRPFLPSIEVDGVPIMMPNGQGLAGIPSAIGAMD